MVKASKFTTFLLATLASFSFAEALNAQTTTTATTATLSIVVRGLRNLTGQVCLGVYNNAPGFPVNAQGIIQRRCVSKTTNSVTVRFTGLRLGNYAVIGFDDENRDFQINQSALGIPTEGLALSTKPNAPLPTAPPTFNDLSFSVQRNTTITVNMTYL